MPIRNIVIKHFKGTFQSKEVVSSFLQIDSLILMKVITKIKGVLEREKRIWDEFKGSPTTQLLINSSHYLWSSMFNILDLYITWNETIYISSPVHIFVIMKSMSSNHKLDNFKQMHMTFIVTEFF